METGGPQKSPPSPPESAADPIGSDQIRHQLADGPPENGRKKFKSKSPRRTKYAIRRTKSTTRRTKSAGKNLRTQSAADKVRHSSAVTVTVTVMSRTALIRNRVSRRVCT